MADIFAECNDAGNHGGAHAEPAKSWDALKAYCTKEDTRAPDTEPFCFPFFFMEKAKMPITVLRPWQVRMKDILCAPPDDRTIRWVYDAEGGIGKSVFTRWLLTRTPAKAIAITGGGQKDLAHAIVNYMDEEKGEGECPTVLIMDCPRASEGRVSYRFLEEIKNGMFTSVKYESQTVTLDKEVHVVVFANSMPDKEKMSSDRWVIHKVENNELVEVEEPEPEGVEAAFAVGGGFAAAAGEAEPIELEVGEDLLEGV